MPGLTPEDEKIIDDKLGAAVKEINKSIDDKIEKRESKTKKELIDMQAPYNKMISEIHQAMVGYGALPGLTNQIMKHECLIEEIQEKTEKINNAFISKKDHYDLNKRVEKLEVNSSGKIEIKKAVITGIFLVLVSLVGSGIIQASFASIKP